MVPQTSVLEDAGFPGSRALNSHLATSCVIHLCNQLICILPVQHTIANETSFKDEEITLIILFFPVFPLMNTSPFLIF